MKLPDRYLITPEPANFVDLNQFKQHLSELIQAGIRLIYLRSKQLDTVAYNRLAKLIAYECQLHSVQLILRANHSSDIWPLAHGIHLTSKELIHYQKRSLPNGFLLLASCHNLEQLQLAKNIGVNAITLSPVLPTNSHPDAVTLGWDKFVELAETVPMPIFALGGMQTQHLPIAKAHGAYGIAAISHFWQSIS